MKGMLHRYATWTRKQASTAQCSPALAAAGFIVVMAAVIYVYRQVILTTIITAALAAVSVAVFIGAIALTISTIRWYRKKAAAERARMVAAPVTMVPSWPTEARVTDDAEAAAISEEAEWLAGGVELAFSPDGKTLVSRDKTGR
jgi:hypothetical protein